MRFPGAAGQPGYRLVLNEKTAAFRGRFFCLSVGLGPVPEQKQRQARETDSTAEPERQVEACFRQDPEGQIDADAYRIGDHGIDAQRGSPVLRGNLSVLQRHLKGLEQGVAQPQRQNGADGGKSRVGQSQGGAGPGCSAVEQKGGWDKAGSAGEPGGAHSHQTQQSGGDIEPADGRVRQPAEFILELIEKDGDGLMGFRQQRDGAQKKQQRFIPQSLSQKGYRLPGGETVGTGNRSQA